MVQFPDRKRHEVKSTLGLKRNFKWLLLSAEEAIAFQQRILSQLPDSLPDLSGDLRNVVVSAILSVFKTPSDLGIHFIKDIITASNLEVEYEGNMVKCNDLGFFNGNLTELYEIVFKILESNYKDVFTAATAVM